MQQVHLAPLRQSFRQGAVQGVHGGGVAVEAGLRRGGVPQQGEGVRFQVEGLWQLLVEIGDEQAGKVIAPRRGVQQVGSQGGVEDEALRPQAVFQQRPRQVLDIVGDLADVRREQGVQKGVPVPLILVEEQLRRDAGVRPGPADHREARQVRQGQHRYMVRRSPEGQQPLRLSRLCDLLHGHGEVRPFRRWLLRRGQAELLDQLGELQLQKQRVGVRAGLPAQVLLGMEVQRRVGNDGGQPVRLPGALLPLRQLADGGRLGLDVRHFGVQVVDALVLLDQGHGGLLPDAGDAGDVVGAVPHQGLQVDHVDGGEAVLLLEGGLRHILGGGLPHAGGHQLHHGVVGNELQAVLVAGDHHAVPAVRLALAGDGADQVVGLPALLLITGNVQGVQHLFQHRHLDPELLRHGLAGGLVGLRRLMAEGWSVDVEGDAQRVRRLLPLQSKERGEKSEDGVGIQPVPCGQGADAIIGPVDDAVAVDDHELHGEFLLPAG